MATEESAGKTTDPSSETVEGSDHAAWEAPKLDRGPGKREPQIVGAATARSTASRQAAPSRKGHFISRSRRFNPLLVTQRDTPAVSDSDDTTATDGAPQAPKSFTAVLYEAITNAFASKNPTQMFCLSWPGTIIDHERMAWRAEDAIAGNMPETSLARSSQILDMYVPPSPITQPDGTRVSDRYAQALSQLGPIPNEHLLALQQRVRERLEQKVQVVVDNATKEMTLLDWFAALQGQWQQARRAWGELQQKMRAEYQARFPGDGMRWWNEYLVWYETNAQSYIDAVNSAYERLISEFPLTAWQDAIAILETSDNAGLTSAKQIMRTASMPLPYQEGSVYTPATGVPYQWPQQLRPNTSFIDLLADPEVQTAVLETAVSQLRQEVLTWRAIIPQIDDDAIAEATSAFDQAFTSYADKQADLLGAYNKNTLLAVNTFVDVLASKQQFLPDIPVDERDGIVENINNLGEALEANFEPVDWEAVSTAATAISDARDGLIKRQRGLVDAGMQLAGAASRMLQQEATKIDFPWLPAYVEQLTTKLAALEQQSQNVASASNNYYRYLTAAPPVEDENPALSEQFGSNAAASKLDSPENKAWMELSIVVSAKEMKTSSQTNTFFSDTQWGLDLFLGSASGTDVNTSTNFASRFMEEESQIQIGCLALKVLINRPWMRPEIFAHTANMFRTVDTPLAPIDQTTAAEITENEQSLMNLINNNSFPAYPIALLIVKDVSVKVKVNKSESEAIRKTEKSTKSQGGGFLCFSVSKAEASESNEEAMSSYTMAGQMVARAPSPQVLGYWVQFLPPDRSQKIDADLAVEITKSLGFVSALQDAFSAGRLVKTTPSRGQ